MGSEITGSQLRLPLGFFLRAARTVVRLVPKTAFKLCTGRRFPTRKRAKGTVNLSSDSANLADENENDDSTLSGSSEVLEPFRIGRLS